MDEDPISFETEYYANEKGDVNSDVIMCMRMYCTQRSFPDFLLQLFFSTAAR